MCSFSGGHAGLPERCHAGGRPKEVLGLSPLGGAAPPEVAVRQDEHWWHEVELLGTQLVVRRASDGRRRREGGLTVSLSIKVGKPVKCKA